MSKVSGDSMAMVFDRANIATARELTKQVEALAPRKDHDAWWSHGVSLFEDRESAQYLVMVADGPARVAQCAPRICVADDDSTLHAALLAADGYLEGRRVMWIMKCAPEVEKSVRAILEKLTTPPPPRGLH